MKNIKFIVLMTMVAGSASVYGMQGRLYQNLSAENSMQIYRFMQGDIDPNYRVDDNSGFTSHQYVAVSFAGKQKGVNLVSCTEVEQMMDIHREKFEQQKDLAVVDTCRSQAQVLGVASGISAMIALIAGKYVQDPALRTQVVYSALGASVATGGNALYVWHQSRPTKARRIQHEYKEGGDTQQENTEE